MSESPARGFPVLVYCRMHGWTTFPRGSRAHPCCEVCHDDREVLMFTAKRHVQEYERERRRAAVLYRRQRSGFWIHRDRRRERAAAAGPIKSLLSSVLGRLL